MAGLALPRDVEVPAGYVDTGIFYHYAGQHMKVYQIAGRIHVLYWTNQQVEWVPENKICLFVWNRSKQEHFEVRLNDTQGIEDKLKLFRKGDLSRKCEIRLHPQQLAIIYNQD
jgi:hypothetical protein